MMARCRYCEVSRVMSCSTWPSVQACGLSRSSDISHTASCSAPPPLATKRHTVNRSPHNFDVIIAGAGPAGSSAAIHLARGGLHVLLVEQKKFPRPKLCGEFISPECRRHFETLGVADAMTDSDPASITETVFYSSRGHHVTIPSTWFGGPAALGLSRAVMDNNLLRRAQECGVTIIEGATITEPLTDKESVRGLKLKLNGDELLHTAPLTIDAT